MLRIVALLLIISASVNCQTRTEINYIQRRGESDNFILYSYDGNKIIILDSLYIRPVPEDILWFDRYRVAFAATDAMSANSFSRHMYVLYDYSKHRSDTLFHENLHASLNFDIFAKNKLFIAAKSSDILTVYLSDMDGFKIIGQIALPEKFIVESSSLSPDAKHLLINGYFISKDGIPEQRTLLAKMANGSYKVLEIKEITINDLGCWDSDSSVFLGDQDDKLFHYFLYGKCEFTDKAMGADPRIVGNRYLIIVKYNGISKDYRLTAYDIHRQYREITIDSGWFLAYTTDDLNNEVLYIKEDNGSYLMIAYEIDADKYKDIIRSQRPFVAPIILR